MFSINYKKGIKIFVFTFFVFSAVFSFVSSSKIAFACETEDSCEDSEYSHNPSCTNTPPSINLIGDNPFNMTVGDTFTDPSATATDTEDGDLTSKIVVTGAVDVSTVGTYVLTYSVTDKGGLSASVVRLVAVSPKILPTNTPPIIHLTGASTVNLTFGDTFTDPGATATDTEDGDLTSKIVVTGTISTSTVGSYTLTYTVTDNGGLSASTTRTVIVNNQTVPHTPSLSLVANPQTITLGATSTLTWSSQDVSSCSATWTLATSTFGSMIVSPATTTDYVMTCTGSYGTTTATSTIIVSIPPVPPVNTPPTITLIGANPFNMTVGDTFTDPGATATDTEDGDLTSKIVVTGTISTSTVGSYTLTYTVTDNGDLSALTTRTVVVNATTTPPVNPPVNPPSNNGGGGGSSGGRRHDINALLAPQGEILGATSCLYLRDYLKIDWENDPVEILKLQSFLNVYEKENLSLTGVFDTNTFAAVQRFQAKYSKDILEPWGPKVTTGFVYMLTKNKINEIYCNTAIPLTVEQQNEISSFKSYDDLSLSSGGTIGISIDKNGDVINEDITSTPVIGLVSSSSGSAVKNVAISLFALPQKLAGNWKSLLILIILVAIVVAIIKLFSNSPEEEFDEASTIALPGFKGQEKEVSDNLPDEEIVVENPEEDLEEIKEVEEVEEKN
ncbi:MAG: immunoglobulin-like domain-containing protein [Patescibacteria group bacterium]